MAGFFNTIGHSLARGYVLSHVARYIHPELLSALLFLTALLGSAFLPFEVLESVSNCIIIEFLMIHANVGTVAAGIFAHSDRSKKRLTALTGGFYFLFVIALAVGMGAWWAAVCFILLLWTRFHEPHDKSDKKVLLNEVFVTMARFVLYMSMGIICAGIGTAIGADDVFKMLAWGAAYYLLLFLLRKKLLRLREARLFAR